MGKSPAYLLILATADASLEIYQTTVNRGKVQQHERSIVNKNKRLLVHTNFVNKVKGHFKKNGGQQTCLVQSLIWDPNP